LARPDSRFAQSPRSGNARFRREHQSRSGCTPKTSLHGYKEGRKADIKGDADKLESNDPKDQQTPALEGDHELELPAEKH